MEQLISVSGLGGKFPAAFLVEVKDRRILLDMGKGPELGVRPDLSQVGMVDAVVLTHAHIDHSGSIDLLNMIGEPPVYASHQTWAHIEQKGYLPKVRKVIPLAGQVNIVGVEITFGRSGHAPGGVWIHIETPAGGILYTGDFSYESILLPFDPPPVARSIIIDASYGDRSESLVDQVTEIANIAQSGAVFFIPTCGRGPDIAMQLAKAGITPKVCSAIASEIHYLAHSEHSDCQPETRDALSEVAFKITDIKNAHPNDIIIAAETGNLTGLAANPLLLKDKDFKFIFTGHVVANSLADKLLSEERARLLGWNVHPRLTDVLNLTDQCKAIKVLPAFINMKTAPALSKALGSRLHLGDTIPI